MSMQNIRYRILDKFNEEEISPEAWNDLLSRSNIDVIFMTWQWQKVWWEVFGRGELLIIVAEQENGKPIAIAPLFAEEGMIFFVGSGGSDYLDFIGDTSDVTILENMLLLAKKQVPDFLGFRFYHVQDISQTSELLNEIAKRTNEICYDEGDLPSPQLELQKFPEQAEQSYRKKSLMRHEAWFIRNGVIEIQHLSQYDDILPYLDEFFEQHITRWRETAYPSLFLDPSQQSFFKLLCKTMSASGWLCFTRIGWEGRSISFHYGFNYKGSFLWYKPSFDISLAKHSPGEVLLRQLLMYAQKEKAHTFDFGLGDELFKKRFATNVITVHNWGLYPHSSIKESHS